MKLYVMPVAAIMLFLSASAQAQLKPEVQTGSKVPTQPNTLKTEEAGIIRKHFARCMYQNAKANALKLLAHSDASTVDLPGAGIKKYDQDLDMDDCLGEEVGGDQFELGMRFTPEMLRDMLAEEDYLARHRSAPELAGPAPPLHFTPISTDKAPSAAQALAEFADCTILRDLAGADALLRTTPGSRKEHDAAAALAPALGACLLVGQKFALKPANIRALIAYAMWARFG